MENKLRRSRNDRVFAGVCSGIAEFFDLDVRTIRIVFLVGLLLGSLTFWLYLIMAIAVPEADRLD